MAIAVLPALIRVGRHDEVTLIWGVLLQTIEATGA